MDLKAKERNISICRDIESNLYVNANPDDLRSALINLSVDCESVIYCIKNTDENIFDFFINNLKTGSTEKHSLKNSKTNFMTISMPKLSADGRYLYFIGHFEDSPLIGNLFRIDLTQKNKKAEWLTDHAEYYYFSNDGRRIVFTDAVIGSPKRNIYARYTYKRGKSFG
ncbi:hypothetical protein ABCY62_00450 [Acetivibrio clariflavus]|uniref:hypothetical protein n=1 Tax=Acetivibrio clariflavus TaxID=288965 RepID=UPI0031F4809B